LLGWIERVLLVVALACLTWAGVAGRAAAAYQQRAKKALMEIPVRKRTAPIRPNRQGLLRPIR
jgi:hypothetical protein